MADCSAPAGSSPSSWARSFPLESLMSLTANDPVHDEDFKSVWGTCSAPDFKAWREWNAEAVAHLNPVVTRLRQQRQHRRNILVQTCRLTAVALCLGFVVWFMGIRNESPVYAQALEQLKAARTVTWTRTYISRVTGADGQRTWFHKETVRSAYQHPGLYRETRLDPEGQTTSITVRNLESGEELTLVPGRKEAFLRRLIPQPNDDGPFGSVDESLSKESLEFLGPRVLGDRNVNFFRYVVPAWKNQSQPAYEFAVDAKTKKLVEFRTWNSKDFHFESDPDRDKPPEPKWKTMRVLGSINSEIVLGAQLDQNLFSVTPPEGYSVQNIERATVTEQEFVELLGVVARYHGGTFSETALRALNASEVNAIHARPKKDWTESERHMVELMEKFVMRYLDEGPVGQFIVDHTEPKTFRYIGKGVKLGEADRIVCWYKLKQTGRYRAVYGDLKVKDVTPDELPLDVQ